MINSLDGTRIVMEVVNQAGRAELVEFRMRSDTVEIRLSDHCVAFLDREYFRSWLWAPVGALTTGEIAFMPFVIDEIALSVDAHHHQLRIILPRVHGWTMEPSVVHQLRACV